MVYKDRRAAILSKDSAKGREHDAADSEFSEGRRNVFVNEGNNLFFAGSDILDRKSYNTCQPVTNY